MPSIFSWPKSSSSQAELDQKPQDDSVNGALRHLQQEAEETGSVAENGTNDSRTGSIRSKVASVSKFAESKIQNKLWAFGADSSSIDKKTEEAEIFKTSSSKRITSLQRDLQIRLNPCGARSRMAGNGLWVRFLVSRKILSQKL